MAGFQLMESAASLHVKHIKVPGNARTLLSPCWLPHAAHPVVSIFDFLSLLRTMLSQVVVDSIYVIEVLPTFLAVRATKRRKRTAIVDTQSLLTPLLPILGQITLTAVMGIDVGYPLTSLSLTWRACGHTE